MQKSLKIALIVTIVIIVALIGGGYYVIQQSKSSKNPQNNQRISTTNSNSNSLPNDNGNTNATNANATPAPSASAIPTQNTTEEDAVLRLARVFTERYGSYSNRSSFENITRLEPFMTERFQQESLQFIEQHTKSGTEEFYGISTTAAALTIDQFKKEQSARVNVSTRRVETRSNQDPRIFSQNATVEFLFVSGNWKVHKFTWK